MTETEVRQAVVGFYDYLSRERVLYLKMWEDTEDLEMKVYYGEKASTYTSIKLYMEKYFSGLISEQRPKERTRNGL